MNSQELRALQEAYMEVVSNQLDEASGGIIGGGNFSSGSSSLKQKPKGSLKIGKKIGKSLSGFSFGGEKPKDIVDRTKSASDKELNNLSRTSDEKEPGKGRSKSGREFQLKVIEREKRKRSKVNEQTDLYDIILSHLLDEGYAETPEAAEAIMVNMSEEWRESICEAEIEPPKERVGALTNIDIPMSEREAARQRTLAKAKAKREKNKN
jgi:hypothetical protein